MAPEPAGAISITTRPRFGECAGTPKSNTRRRGRSISRYSPQWSTSTPSRRSVKMNTPPTSGTSSARTMTPCSVANRNRRAVDAVRNASNTRSGAWEKVRETCTAIGASFVVSLSAAFFIALCPPRLAYGLAADGTGGRAILVVQQALERIEARVPQRALLLDPGRDTFERRRVECQVMLASHLSPADELRALQHPNVLGHGVQRHGERLRELRDASFAGRKPLQNGAPRGI